jgi:hypothetical protein
MILTNNKLIIYFLDKNIISITKMSNKSATCDFKGKIFVCPHCNEPVMIQKINCGIFRHAVLKSNGKQISPHTGEKKCEKLIKEKAIYGCGKPFRIIKILDKLEIEVCGYL